MPTYRKDVKIGTMIPLIKTDDISDGAITKEKLDKDLRDEIQPKKEAVKKKRKQIIIGRAIRPGSMKRSDVENWYAFIEKPCFIVYAPQKDSVIHLYVRNEHIDYEEKNSYCAYLDSEGNNRYYFNGLGRCLMFKVDDYQRDGNIHYLYLTYKDAPRTLKGQSITTEWQNGKRVSNKKISLEAIREDLTLWSNKKYHSNSYLEYRRITSCWKARERREYSISFPGIKKKCRREVSWLTNSSTQKSFLKTGLYKVRSVKKGYKTNWQTIYVKVWKGFVKDVVFK